MTNSDFEDRLQQDVEGPYEVELEESGRILIGGGYVEARWDPDAAEEIGSIHGDEAAEEMYDMVARAIDKHTAYDVDI